MPHLLALALVVALLVFGQPSSSTSLGETLNQWRKEIEKTGKHRVIVVRVYTDRATGHVYLPDDTEERRFLIPYFENVNFLKQLIASQTLGVNQKAGDVTYHFILLNMLRESEWSGHEDAVIGHELGHAWLLSQDYGMPAYEGNKRSCLAVLTSDVVQHGLIREELARRQIDYFSYWLPQLDKSLERLERGAVLPPEKTPTCQLISRATLWLDTRMALSPKTWPHYERYQTVMRERYPILEGLVRELESLLRKADLHDRAAYDDALLRSLHTIYGFVKLVLKRDEGPGRGGDG